MDYRVIYEPLAREAARLCGVDEYVFLALITRESSWNPHVVANDGATGICQIMPWAHPGVNPKNPEQSLTYCAQLIRNYLDQHKHDYRWALAAYNVGGPTVASWTSVPQWELDRYILPILNLADVYRKAEETPVATLVPALEVSSTVTISTATPPSPYVVTPTPTPPVLLFGAIFLALLLRK